MDEHEAGGKIENDTQGFDNRNFVESCRGPWGGQQVERHGIGNTKRWIVLRDRGRVEVTVEDVAQTVGVEVPVRGHEQWKEDDGHLEEALLHGPEQIADLPVPVAESPGAVRIGHPERSHLVEYLAPNSVFNSLPRQRSSPHLRPDDRLVTIDRVLHHASLGVA